MRYERTEGDLAFFINRPFTVDGRARLRYGKDWQQSLEPCQPIQDKNLCIGRLDNSQLKPHRFLISDFDRTPILAVPRVQYKEDETFSLTLPGKSTFVLLEPNACDKMFIKDVVTNLFEKEDSDRHDHVHVASVEKINEAGWVPYYAPLQLKWLFDHVRLIAKRTIDKGEDPTLEDAENLISAFTLIPNLHG